MAATYPIADMMVGVRNMIEAANLRRGDQVLLLADTRSDQPTLEALSAGLGFFGAEPMTLVTEPIARYGDVPQPVGQGDENRPHPDDHVRCAQGASTSTTVWWWIGTACSIARCCTIPKCSRRLPSSAIRTTCCAGVARGAWLRNDLVKWSSPIDWIIE